MEKLAEMPPLARVVVASAIVDGAGEMDSYEMHTIRDVHDGFHFDRPHDTVAIEVARNVSLVLRDGRWIER
jgi:hypothetical protein